MDDIDCTKVLHALYEFLDGELTMERRQYIELHLSGCQHCFSVFDFEAELRIVLRSRLRVEPPPTLRQRIVQALEQEAMRSYGSPGAAGTQGMGLPGLPPLGPPGRFGGPSPLT